MKRRRGPLRIVGLLAVAALASGCSRFVILHDPLSAAEHNDLGVAYESRGQIDLADREYRRALKLDSRMARARVNLGNLAARAERWGEAERCYRRALRDRPDDPDAMNNLAIALIRQHRGHLEALALAELAAARGGPRDSVYRSTLAEVRAARPRP